MTPEEKGVELARLVVSLLTSPQSPPSWRYVKVKRDGVVSWDVELNYQVIDATFLAAENVLNRAMRKVGL